MMTVTILGTPYSVAIERISKSTYGRCDYHQRLITLNSRFPDSYRSTLVHEVIHAILHEAGIDNLLTTELNEAIVISVENGLRVANLIDERKIDYALWPHTKSS